MNFKMDSDWSSIYSGHPSNVDTVNSASIPFATLSKLNLLFPHSRSSTAGTVTCPFLNTKNEPLQMKDIMLRRKILNWTRIEEIDNSLTCIRFRSSLIRLNIYGIYPMNSVEKILFLVKFEQMRIKMDEIQNSPT